MTRRQFFARRSAGKQEPSPRDEMKENDQPKEALVGDLFGFVPEYLLGQECSGPASGQFEQVKRFFGDALAGPASFVFIPGIDRYAYQADGEISCGDPQRKRAGKRRRRKGSEEGEAE